MRNLFGNKDTFAIECEYAGNGECYFEIWVDKKDICCFYKDEILQEFKWNLDSLVEWIKNSMGYITTEEEFPLPITANSSIEFYNKSSEFDSEDKIEFDRWFDTRQEWCFRHSWLINRDGGFLADVFFRANNGKIEIQWDNTNTYEGIKFKYPVGIFYVDKRRFNETIYAFLNSYGRMRAREIMKYKIFYEYDSERDDWEALNKGYRADVSVIIGGKRYKLYVTDITRLKQDVESEFEYSGEYQDQPNTVIVKEVTKECIKNKVEKLIACHYFDEIHGEVNGLDGKKGEE